MSLSIISKKAGPVNVKVPTYDANSSIGTIEQISSSVIATHSVHDAPPLNLLLVPGTEPNVVCHVEWLLTVPSKQNVSYPQELSWALIDDIQTTWTVFSTTNMPRTFRVVGETEPELLKVIPGSRTSSLRDSTSLMLSPVCALAQWALQKQEYWTVSN